MRTSAVSSEGVATALGYLVGAGSLALYTPIVWRVSRQGDASGLTLSTWWLKLASYSCSDVYSIAQGYPISTPTLASAPSAQLSSAEGGLRPVSVAGKVGADRVLRGGL